MDLKTFKSKIKDFLTFLEVEKNATQGMAMSQSASLVQILINNFRVLAFCILFSFLYGAGAIYILTLNASVIGVAIGSLIREGFTILASIGKANTVMAYFAVVPLGFTYLVHGIPEVTSYFTGALAGGIISVAVVCHHYKTKRFKQIVLDSVDLVALSIIILILSALIEVYITPNLI